MKNYDYRAVFSTRATQGMLALSAALMLAACGGGGGGDAGAPPLAVVPGTGVPVAATQDSQAAFDFVASVVAKGEANADDPIVLGDATLAVSETADPVTIIAA